MKIRTFGRHIKEGAKNIGRNGWMTFAAISAVSVTLLILGIFILLAMNINHIIGMVENQVEINVELDLGSTQQEIQYVEEQLNHIYGVKSVVFVSKEEGLQELKEKFGNESYLLDGLEEENPLNDKFIVKVTSASLLKSVAVKMKSIDNVSYVDYGQATVEKLIKFATWIRNIGLVFIAGLAFTTMFLISNTIKMTIYARKKELEIMKLVGATNGFIRFPFFIEGLLLGFFGSIIPIGILVFGYKVLLDQLGSSLSYSFIEFLPLFPLAYQISILLVVIGAFIGIWGSMVSVRKFLRKTI